MIVSDAYRCVYVAIPKTGTLSVRTWLRQHYKGRALGRELRDEPFGHPRMTYHNYLVPEKYRDYLIFTTVRNPYARAYSLYKFFRSKEPFLDYLKRLSVYNPPGGGGHRNEVMHATQAQYVKESGATHIVKLENLEEILELPFVDKDIMPQHLRKRTDIPPPYTDYYNEEEDKVLWEYCQEDFETFGYDRIY